MNYSERIWCSNATMRGGSFVSAFADACLRADDHNITILKPALVQIMEKYPDYSKTR